MYMSAVFVFFVSFLSSSFSAPLTYRDSVGLSGLNDATQSGFLCDICYHFVSVIQHLFDTHASEDIIQAAAIKLCELSGIEDHYICSTIVPEFKDEVLTIFDQTALSSYEICSQILELKCNSYDPFNTTWTITVPGGKPPPINPYPIPKANASVNRILHVTDIHWDPQYTEGLSNQCNEPLCCRPPNKRATSREESAGAWGDEHCDIPYRTVLSLMEWLESLQSQFDWVYVTGDLPAHNDWTQTRDGQLSILQNITLLFKKYLPGKPVFFAIGNHESAPVNSFPPPFITGDQSESWLYDYAADQWQDWLTPDAIKTLKYGGYYAMEVLPDLKVISLQTNFCNKDNWWLLINSTDPANMLEWLIKELLVSERTGQKVHLIGHIPSTNCITSWAHAFHKIVFRFENTISGYFYGHTHTDQFYVLHAIEEGTQRPFGVGYIAPSVTGYQFHTAAYRYYIIDGTYEGSSRTVIDHYTYIMNITDANLTNKPKWVLEYSAKDAYDLSSLSPQSWDNLIGRFVEDDKLFQTFAKYVYKSSVKNECHGKCKDKLICFMKEDFPSERCNVTSYITAC